MRSRYDDGMIGEGWSFTQASVRVITRTRQSCETRYKFVLVQQSDTSVHVPQE